VKSDGAARPSDCLDLKRGMHGDVRGERLLRVIWAVVEIPAIPLPLRYVGLYHGGALLGTRFDESDRLDPPTLSELSSRVGADAADPVRLAIECNEPAATRAFDDDDRPGSGDAASPPLNSQHLEALGDQSERHQDVVEEGVDESIERLRPNEWRSHENLLA